MLRNYSQKNNYPNSSGGLIHSSFFVQHFLIYELTTILDKMQEKKFIILYLNIYHKVFS